MPRRNPTVPILTLLNRRFPGLDDPVVLIKEGAVLIDGMPAASPRTRVRAGAAVRIRRPRVLRGTIKLTHALTGFGVDAAAARALEAHGWQVRAQQPSPILGAKGAVEVFLHASSTLCFS